MIEVFNNSLPLFQSSLSGVVGAILGTLFLSGNEFKKLIAKKFSEITDILLKDGKISYSELYRCHNFLKIAKLADGLLPHNGTDESHSNKYDFDWFIRFFDSVGYISNEEMQQLWAKVLAGEITRQGSFSFRTLELIKNLSHQEAELFQKISGFVLTGQTGLRFILCMSDDLGVDINELYGIGRKEFIQLEDCGLLSSIRSDNRISLTTHPSGIWNNEIILCLRYKRTDGVLNSYKYSSYTLTPSACQLLSVVDQTPDNDYLIAIGQELAKKYSGNLIVSAHKIIDANPYSFKYEDNDLLEGWSNNEM